MVADVKVKTLGINSPAFIVENSDVNVDNSKIHLYAESSYSFINQTIDGMLAGTKYTPNYDIYKFSTNINNSEFVLKSNASSALINQRGAKLNLIGSTANITSVTGSGIINNHEKSVLNIINSKLNAKSAIATLSLSTGGQTNLSNNSVLNLESQNEAGIQMVSNLGFAPSFNIDGSSHLNIKTQGTNNLKQSGIIINVFPVSGINTSINFQAAVNKLRDFTSQFGNYYSIVTSREDFTQNMINVLTEGADKLTLADMNTESANMLALQTRQQLAINSLSLASQASQSVLKLF